MEEYELWKVCEYFYESLKTARNRLKSLDFCFKKIWNIFVKIKILRENTSTGCTRTKKVKNSLLELENYFIELEDR